jgi:hypothetical protein
MMVISAWINFKVARQRIIEEKMCNKEHENARKVLKRRKDRMQGLTVVFWVMTSCILVGRYWHFGGTCCLHLQEDYTLNTRRCVKINPINLQEFEDQPANRNCSLVKRSQNQHSLMKESNSLLEKRQEAITPFISGNLGKTSRSLPLTLGRNVHQKETIFRNAAKSEVMRKDKRHFSGRWHTNQSSAKSNLVWLPETQQN